MFALKHARAMLRFSYRESTRSTPAHLRRLRGPYAIHNRVLGGEVEKGLESPVVSELNLTTARR